jgi:hypothetical protein
MELMKVKMDASGDDELVCLEGLEKYIRTIGSGATNDQLVYREDFKQSSSTPRTFD